MRGRSRLAHFPQHAGSESGEIIAAGLSTRQIDQFQECVLAGDSEAATNWLDEYCPNYQEIAEEQFELLVVSIRKDAFWILAVEEVISDHRDLFEDLFSALDTRRAA